MNNIEKYSIFVQEFHIDSPTEQMVGTEKYPAYLMGWTDEVTDEGYYGYYPYEQAKNYPGIITPRYLKCERVNIQIGERYFRGIELPKESATFTYGKDWYRIHFTFR